MSTYLGASIIPMILNLATNPLIAMNMTPTDYAVSGYYLSYTSLIGPIISFYLVHYFIKEYYKRDTDGRIRLFAIISKALIYFSGLVSFICFLGIFVYLKYFNPTFSYPILPYLAMMVFSLPFTGLLTLQQAQYRMERNAKSYFFLSLKNSLIGVGLLILFIVIFKWGAFGRLLAPLICNFVMFLYMIFRFRKILNTPIAFKEIKPILIFCLPLSMSATLGYFTNGYSTTALEGIGDTYEYGIYIIGNTIGLYLNTFAKAISNTFQSDIYQATVSKQWRKLFKFCAIQLSTISFICIVFIILAPQIVSILTAGRYTSATIYSQIIALSTLTSGCYYLINDFTIAIDCPKIYLYTSILSSVFIIVCLPLAINRWAYYGGAWMSVIAFVIYCIFNIILLLGVKFKIIPERYK